MRLKERFLLKPGYMNRIDDFSGLEFREILDGADEVSPHDFNCQKHWILQAQLSISFWANDANRDAAETIAHRQIMHELYRDILVDIARLEKMLSDGNRQGCYEVINNIRSELMGSK